MIGWNTTWLHPIKVVDIAGILSGELAVRFGNGQLDYWYAMIWLVVLVILIAGVLKLLQWRSYNSNKQNMTEAKRHA
jgi:L-asparagine transporter-like permease